MSPRTSPLPVRLPEGMKEQLDAAAAKVGLTRNALIVKSLERTLGMQHVDDDLPAEAHVCKHPKEHELKLAYGTFCRAPLPTGRVCGARIR